MEDVWLKFLYCCGVRSSILKTIHLEDSFLQFLWFGMEERYHKSHCLSESQFTEYYFNMIMHKVLSFLWFSITVLVYLNVPTPVFLLRLIEIGSKVKHFHISLIVPGKIFCSTVLEMENKIQDSDFFFWKTWAK